MSGPSHQVSFVSTFKSDLGGIEDALKQCAETGTNQEGPAAGGHTPGSQEI